MKLLNLKNCKIFLTVCQSFWGLPLFSCASTVNIVQVPSVDKFTEKITKACGKAIQPKQAILGVGYMAGLLSGFRGKHIRNHGRRYVRKVDSYKKAAGEADKLFPLF